MAKIAIASNVGTKSLDEPHAPRYDGPFGLVNRKNQAGAGRNALRHCLKSFLGEA